MPILARRARIDISPNISYSHVHLLLCSHLANTNVAAWVLLNYYTGAFPITKDHLEFGQILLVSSILFNRTTSDAKVYST